MSSDNFYAIIDGKIVELIDGSIDYELDAVDSFDLSVYAEDIEYARIKGAEVSVYKNAELLISGIVQDRPQFQYQDDQKYVFKLKCNGELGRLSCYRSRTSAHYQDETVYNIVTNLLFPYALYWEVELVNYADYTTDKTTIDLRNKETLFSQISEVIKSVPNLHLRYGGKNNAGKHVLQIGRFDSILYSAKQGENLQKLELISNSSKTYRIVESYGGFTDIQRITLADALDDARTTAHADYTNYPIVYDAGSATYYCENLSDDDSCAISKKFELTKTSNTDAPTAAEVAEAGYALWRKTVRFLQQNQKRESYKATVFSDQKLTLGDRIHISAQAVEVVYNEFNMEAIEIPLMETNSDYKITKIGVELETYISPNELESKLNYGYSYTIEVTSGEEAENFDSEVELYDRTETVSSAPNALKISKIYEVTDSHDGTEAGDCDFTTPNTGKLFTFPLPPAPAWANNVYFTVSSLIPSTTRYVIEYYSVTDLVNDIELCIAPAGGAWSTLAPTDVVDVTISIYFGE